MKAHFVIRKVLLLAIGIGTPAALAQSAGESGGQLVWLPTVSAERAGQGANEYWIFSPEGTPIVTAPVVLFVHGWGAMDPYLYGGWILHLIRNGNIVIYPRYQESLETRLNEMTPNAVESVQDALERLAAVGPVVPDCNRIAIVGHSMGGVIAMNLAADSSLPTPRAVMIIEPGDGEDRMPRLGEKLPLADPSGLSIETLFLLVTGDADTVVGNRGATKIWSALGDVPVANRVFATLASDYRLNPPLLADHLSPLAVDRSFPEEPTLGTDKQSIETRSGLHQRWAARFASDALDYDGYWKMFDELLDAGFGNTRIESGATAVFSNASRRMPVDLCKSLFSDWEPRRERP